MEEENQQKHSSSEQDRAASITLTPRGQEAMNQHRVAISTIAGIRESAYTHK
jgi:hypothetical protein